MDIGKKVELAKRAPAIELVTEEELRGLFEAKAHPKHYIGFEISGYVHLGTGLMTALKIRDLMEAGVKPCIFLADYHAWINGKMGGDLEGIRKIGMGYFKHAFVALGLPEDKVRFVLASEIYDEDYWKMVLDIMRNTTTNRMLRCVTAMGRKESDALSSAAMIYPAMQAADIFKLEVDIAHAGMDQRKVHMLAREIAPKLGEEKPVALHTGLLPGLQSCMRMNPTEDEVIEAKMSKSVPDSAIFVHESEAEIRRKIGKAVCAPKAVEGNPMLQYAEMLVLRDRPLKIERPAKFGGDLEIADSAQLRKEFAEGKLHPMDLKNAMAGELCGMLKPAREYFEKHP
ncbi:MAG TPA: tyrosine--tRNA ligase, partial [Candidatus Bilamarchaeaceae archaeon]|nr:tyrosine--tRNA ligase [Candidatus Bilamarchaeaceae archaeon]